jgi:hypothetical protein
MRIIPSGFAVDMQSMHQPSVTEIESVESSRCFTVPFSWRAFMLLLLVKLIFSFPMMKCFCGSEFTNKQRSGSDVVQFRMLLQRGPPTTALQRVRWSPELSTGSYSTI